MGKERINLSHEYNKNPEALAEAGAERREQLRERLEKNVENSQEDVGEAKKEVLEIYREKQEHHQERLEASPAERRRTTPNKKEEEASFSATMKEVRSQMSAPSRSFSKLIHNKTIEKVSEGVGNTVARPNAILSGAIAAFALTLGVYLLAKNLGYPLSGFETIAAFLFGWALGIIYDFLKVMVTGRQ